ARPIGRAALALSRQGLRVVFGDTVEDGRITGLEAVPGGWRTATSVPVAALHDRFPSQRRAAHFARILAAAGSMPIGNPPELTLLCRDKLRCQMVLGAAGVDAQPPIEADPTRFAGRLAAWGVGFLKPRYGALGIGVCRVVPGDPLPASLPGAIPGRRDPAILQRAVPPPARWAGWSVRVVCQRAPGGMWVQGEPAVRRHRTDPVVNAARGAEVAPGRDVLPKDTAAAVCALSARVTDALDTLPCGRWAVEVGVDLAIDTDGAPWLIEVNSRPRGRMEALAAADPGRFHDAHVAACGRPLLALAWIAEQHGRAAPIASP
ncbi:MAG: YheC/YheD family protein, partial [Myxococcota bacterium]|nr:YheC/YheD family protein [Myxococcota bacterium]